MLMAQAQFVVGLQAVAREAMAERTFEVLSEIAETKFHVRRLCEEFGYQTAAVVTQQALAEWIAQKAVAEKA